MDNTLPRLSWSKVISQVLFIRCRPCARNEYSRWPRTSTGYQTFWGVSQGICNVSITNRKIALLFWGEEVQKEKKAKQRTLKIREIGWQTGLGSWGNKAGGGGRKEERKWKERKVLTAANKNKKSKPPQEGSKLDIGLLYDHLCMLMGYMLLIWSRCADFHQDLQTDM